MTKPTLSHADWRKLLTKERNAFCDAEIAKCKEAKRKKKGEVK